MTESMKPTRKITSVGVAGSATAVLLWALSPVIPPVPAEIAAAITTLVSGVIGWWVPDKK